MKATKLSEYSKLKRKATKIETWSTEQTQLPAAYSETVEQYAKISPERIISFRFKVWLKPHTKQHTKQVDVSSKTKTRVCTVTGALLPIE